MSLTKKEDPRENYEQLRDYFEAVTPQIQTQESLIEKARELDEFAEELDFIPDDSFVDIASTDSKKQFNEAVGKYLADYQDAYLVKEFSVQE